MLFHMITNIIWLLTSKQRDNMLLEIFICRCYRKPLKFLTIQNTIWALILNRNTCCINILNQSFPIYLACKGGFSYDEVQDGWTSILGIVEL